MCGGGSTVSDGHSSQPMEAGASKMGPQIGPFQLLMANGRRERGRVYWPYFLPAAGPHSPRRRGREGQDLCVVRFGDFGSWGAALGAIPAGAAARGGEKNLKWLTIATFIEWLSTGPSA